MALVDQEQAAMVLRYTPKVTRDDWPQFEKQLTRRIHHSFGKYLPKGSHFMVSRFRKSSSSE